MTERTEPSRCSTCGAPMTKVLNEENPGALDCGGDCAQCMADAGDPDCQKLLGVNHEEAPR